MESHSLNGREEGEEGGGEGEDIAQEEEVAGNSRTQK